MDRSRLVTASPSSDEQPSVQPRTSLPADKRPFDFTPIVTEDLPLTPTRDRNIAASAWTSAPEVLLTLGADIGISADKTAYKRRLGTWLLWRAGPARGADARYLAIDPDDHSSWHVFELSDDGTGAGTGPSGEMHTRFRAWKQDLVAD